MQDNVSQRWSIGLQFFQWQKNCSFHRTIGRSPYNALFENDPKVGLASSRFSNNFVQTITTEEEIEETEEILQCSTVNYTCGICKIEINEVENQDEAGSIMCNLCRKKNRLKCNEKKVLMALKNLLKKCCRYIFK